jgi:hypothetical protein
LGPSERTKSSSDSKQAKIGQQFDGTDHVGFGMQACAMRLVHTSPALLAVHLENSLEGVEDIQTPQR